VKGLWGGLLGALTLGASTAYYHTQLPSQTAGEIVWGVVLLQAAPAGLLLGTATEWALRVPVGGRRALCCFLGGLLGLVPPGIWGWLAASGDPLHALPKLWETLVLCMPTLGASAVLTIWGVTNLRPARFRKKEGDE
jgi:hypothetical protein